MSKIVPANEAMVRDLKPQPKMPSNYCCLGCCGKASGPVDVNKIVADGGKFLQTSDGRKLWSTLCTALRLPSGRSSKSTGLWALAGFV
jgi:hypothetical protein